MSVPALAWLLVRLTLRGDARARALADLADVHARVRALRGIRAARAACVREAVSIVAW